MHSARRFAADASHELQTPLAAVRTALEMSLRGGRDASDYRETVGELLTDLDRLSALVRDLRLLALADAGHLLDRVAVVDLSALAAECCEFARVVAEPNDIAVESDLGESLEVSGSELHLRRVLINLLENAIRYSPSDSVLEIRVAGANGQASVRVSTTGAASRPGPITHLRGFYRANPARARETGGTGLGLAIADQIVGATAAPSRSHRTEHGSTFTVTLPLAPHASEPADRWLDERPFTGLSSPIHSRDSE